MTLQQKLRLPVRTSTAALILIFAGLLVLYYGVRPDSAVSQTGQQGGSQTGQTRTPTSPYTPTSSPTPSRTSPSPSATPSSPSPQPRRSSPPPTPTPTPSAPVGTTPTPAPTPTPSTPAAG
jgi:hypothetical protein